MLSLKYHFLFVHIPKTAGNSIQSALAPFSDDRLIKEYEFQDGRERFGIKNEEFEYPKHATLREYKRILPEITYHSLTKFTVVRNPWDRLISRYFSPHEGRKEFDRELFKRIIHQSQPLDYYVNSSPNWSRLFPINPLKSSEIDFFLKFENLEEDFSKICSFLGLSNLSLENLNYSQRFDYQYYYDFPLKEKVYNKFRKEINFFGYEFD
mgnify:CR=1 FL=1